MKTTIKMKGKEAKALVDLMCALNATEVFSGHENLSDELYRLVNEVNDQLKAGNKTICLESDFDTLSDEDIQKLSLLDKIDLDFDLEGLLDEDEINEIGEVINGIVSDNSADNQSNNDKEGEDHMSYNNLPLFPKSDEAIRYGTFTMANKEIGYYRFAVAINPDGTINRIIDCLAGNQKRDEYIDRSDKFYDDLMCYLANHKDDPDFYLHLSPYDVVCSEKSAIHSLRGNIFKTYEEYVEHVNSCYGV